MQLTVTDITILIHTGSVDYIWLQFEGSALMPQSDPGVTPCATATAAGGYGIEYARKNWPGVPFCTLSQETGEYTQY